MFYFDPVPYFHPTPFLYKDKRRLTVLASEVATQIAHVQDLREKLKVQSREQTLMQHETKKILRSLTP